MIVLSLCSYIRLLILAFRPEEYNQSTTHNLIFLQSLRAPPHDWERAVKDWYNEVRLLDFGFISCNLEKKLNLVQSWIAWRHFLEFGTLW